MTLTPKSLNTYFVILLVVAVALISGVALTVRGEDVAIAIGIAMAGLVVVNMVIYSLMTKKNRAEEKLRKSEELFKLILNGINDGVFDYNIAEGTIYYSPAYKTILGYTGEELGATHDVFDTLVHPDDRAPSRQLYESYIRREIPTYYNVFRMRHKEGHYVWVLSRGVAIWDAQGRIRRLAGTHTDVTEQKSREEEMLKLMRENDHQREELIIERDRSEAANQAKSEFLATMSHEIRTPMNAVIGLARLMMTTKLDAKQQEMMRTLHSNADILLHLVNDLLDLNRIEAAQVELENHPFTLQGMFDILRTMFQHQAKNKGIDFTILNRVGAQTFVGDPMRIQQILVNLIGNALKFTSVGGISITADAMPRVDGRVQVQIAVNDTGVGILPEKIGTIFDKFVQADQTISRRFGGSGLGLAICKALAQLMGGDISVSSKANAGSAFTFTVPLNVSEGQQAIELAPVMPSIPHMQEAVAAKRTALVVEDYPANIMVTTMMLEDLGFNSDVAKSGMEAIEKLNVRSHPYDVILMDVQMPGMDGFEATRRIRDIEKQKGFRHTIIGVTANAMAGDRDRCLTAGMDDYIAKPVHPDVLEKKLMQLEKVA